jgi:exodeoxyribonuclease VII small subunit
MSEKISTNQTKPMDEMSYEQAISKLNEIIDALEGKEQSLENALSLYEQGQELLNHCTYLLNDAELRVQQILSTGLEDIPFEE